MIYSIAGLPGRFSEWCETVLTALLSKTTKRVELLVADSLEMLGQQLLARDSLAAVVVARQPLSSLCQALLATGRPPLVVVDQPAKAVGALVEDYGLGYAEATRRVANSLTALAQLTKAERVLVLNGSDADPPEHMVRTIAEHFALAADDTLIAQIVSDHPPRPEPAVAQEPYCLAPLPDFGEMSPPSCDLALQPLWDHLRGSPPAEILWSPHLFFRADDGDPALPIAVTGRGRSLIYGPYIRLPKGPWSCRVLFASSANAVGTQMLAEIFAGSVLNSVRFVLRDGGVFEIEFAFDNNNADTPLELRLFTAAAAFDGDFVLGHVRLCPLPAPRITVT